MLPAGAPPVVRIQAKLYPYFLTYSGARVVRLQKLRSRVSRNGAPDYSRHMRPNPRPFAGDEALTDEDISPRVHNARVSQIGTRGRQAPHHAPLTPYAPLAFPTRLAGFLPDSRPTAAILATMARTFCAIFHHRHCLTGLLLAAGHHVYKHSYFIRAPLHFSRLTGPTSYCNSPIQWGQHDNAQ